MYCLIDDFRHLTRPRAPHQRHRSDAKLLGLQGKTGTLEADMATDLIAVDRVPLTDLTALE